MFFVLTDGRNSRANSIRCGSNLDLSTLLARGCASLKLGLVMTVYFDNNVTNCSEGTNVQIRYSKLRYPDK